MNAYELDITDFFKNAAAAGYSASVAELGPTAARDTWQAACDDSEDYPLLQTDEQREAFRAFVRSSGGWTAEEVAAWSDTELNALCIQWVAGDLRESGLFADSDAADWAQYETDGSAGRVSSRICRGGDGKVYFCIAE